MARLHRSAWLPSIVKGLHTSRSGQVVYTVNPDKQDSYRILANFVNRSDYDVVCLQHEYGLFGGSWGHHLLEFLRRCEKPIVTICHTVMEDPTSEAVSVLQEVARHSAAIVVMANAAIEMLERYYNIRGENIVVIPHGVPQFRFSHRQSLKDNLGLLGKQVISTFGLVSRGKGLETMIKAMHYVLRPTRTPSTSSSARPTRPSWPRRGNRIGRNSSDLAASLPNPDGRAVRQPLRQAGRDRRVPAGQRRLCFALPGYNQITSGTLSFALAAGKAIVSTPYIHAIEALAHGRGDPRTLPRRMHDGPGRQLPPGRPDAPRDHRDAGLPRGPRLGLARHRRPLRPAARRGRHGRPAEPPGGHGRRQPLRPADRATARPRVASSRVRRLRRPAGKKTKAE